MTVNLKLNCQDIVGELREGAYELKDGATVAELLEAAHREAGSELTESAKQCLIFLYDNRHADWDTRLSDGGRLRVLYKVLGG